MVDCPHAGGSNNDAFPFEQLSPLISELRVDWHAFSGEDLGELLCVLLLWPACQADPGRAGDLLRPLLQSQARELNAEEAAAACAVHVRCCSPTPACMHTTYPPCKHACVHINLHK